MRAILAAVVLVALMAPAAAHALPGDPPFEPLTPADGAALPVDPGGIPVTFSCPVYRTYDAGEGFALYGGPKDYSVLMSAGTATGPDGRLTDPVTIVYGQAIPGQDGQCSAVLSAGGSVRPQETPGAYHWQVSRLCTGCTTGYETGPIRALTLVSTVKPTVSALGRAYAGFPFLVKVAADGAASGTTVTVERQSGAAWVKAGAGTVASGVAEVAVTAARKGSAQLRARLTSGTQDVVGEATAIAVRSASGGKRTAVRAGAWTGNHDVSFTVSGRTIKRFTGRIPLLCPTPGMVSPFTTMIGTASLKSARLAPDGSFLGAATASGSAFRIRGRLSGSRSSGGRIELSLGGCTGNASFSAKRAR
ncbi:hypothetical protein [Baekduia sp. Peel2402]|uniref:hypothetical protein n=1 Tax=Baekduia sp. Peel2402 TaxID=3458296 RepID=UPI00403E3F18